MAHPLLTTSLAAFAAAIFGCFSPSVAHVSAPQPTFPVFVGVTNESMVSRPLELRIKNVAVVDTVVGEPLNATGQAGRPYLVFDTT